MAASAVHSRVAVSPVAVLTWPTTR
jgi:hypothetical protein